MRYLGGDTELVSNMLLEEVWSMLAEKVLTTPSTPTLFNLYRDTDTDYDRSDAADLRRSNLREYLACYRSRPEYFLLAEAPGPWGCRFSGVPLVAEAQLQDPAFPIHGQVTSLAPTPHAEYSARIYWRELMPWFPRFFTWNSVPYHPHHPGQPLTIRTPTAREITASLDVLTRLLELVKPRLILAVGRKAEYALGKVGAEAIYIRHPSQGGARQFAEGVRAVLNA